MTPQTGAGFPHSDIHGSKLGRQLPVAYRSLPRPSSAPGAKHPPLALCSLENKDARARNGVLKVQAVRLHQPAVQQPSRTVVLLGSWTRQEAARPLIRSAHSLKTEQR